MSNMEQMQHYIKGLKAQARVLLDGSVGGTIKINNEDKVKELIGKICQNDYRSQSERWVKLNGVIELDANIGVLT